MRRNSSAWSAAWRGIARPTAAAAALDAAGFLGWIAAGAAGLVPLALQTALLVIAMHALDRLPQTPALVDLWAAFVAEYDVWITGPLPTPAGSLLGWLLLSGALACVLLAWQTLPFAARADGLLPALRRALAAVISSLGLLFHAETLLGGLMLVVIFVMVSTSRTAGPEGPLTVVAGMGLTALLVARRIGLTAAELAARVPPAPDPPRCEGCGYDLTHRPSDERCPECAREVARSLGESADRAGAMWTYCGTWTLALSCALQVVTDPRSLYTRLRLRERPTAAAGDDPEEGDPARDDDPLRAALRFSLIQYVALGLACWGCAFTGLGLASAATWSGLSTTEAIAICTFSTVMTLGLAWVGHRLVGAVAAAIWIGRRTLPDARWSAIVMEYETAFLWVFFVVQWSLLLSFYVAEDWVTSLVGRTWALRVLGGPAEPAVMLGLIVLLGMLWLARLERIGRMIRWANY